MESGSHAQLVALKGLYYAMWRQQIGERAAAPAGRPRVPDDGDEAGAELAAQDFVPPK